MRRRFSWMRLIARQQASTRARTTGCGARAHVLQPPAHDHGGHRDVGKGHDRPAHGARQPHLEGGLDENHRRLPHQVGAGDQQARDDSEEQKKNRRRSISRSAKASPTSQCSDDGSRGLARVRSRSPRGRAADSSSRSADRSTTESAYSIQTRTRSRNVLERRLADYHPRRHRGGEDERHVEADEQLRDNGALEFLPEAIDGERHRPFRRAGYRGFSRTSSSGADHGYGSISISAGSATRGPMPLGQMNSQSGPKRTRS